MSLGLLAKKIGMAQVFNEHGRAVAVTVLQAGPCTVTRVREPKQDGYQALQLGFEDVDESRLTKPVLGQFKKSGIGPFRYLKEFRVSGDSAYTVGQEVKADIFKEGELIDVCATSIGKGFQGGMRRWNWKGGPASHGSMSHRAPGSIGSTTSPGRVIKGHHLPGHMGNDTVTIQNLRIMKIDTQENIILVEGAVPGPERQVVIVKRSVKKPGVVKAAKSIQEIFVEEEETSKSKAKKS